MVHDTDAGKGPSICVGTIHHIRYSMDGELMIDRFLDAMDKQEDPPDRVLICDTQPTLPKPHLERYGDLKKRVQVIERPMKTLQEGFNFYPQARNEILKACREDVIIWVDADERLDPDVVGRVRKIFKDKDLGAGILCLRPIPKYWGIAEELRYVAKHGHLTARLRIFRTDLLRSLGGFEKEKPEWGTLASKIYPQSREGSLKISHEKLYASHDSPTKILARHSMRLLSHYQQSKKKVYTVKILLIAYLSSIAILILTGYLYLALLFMALPPTAIYLWHLVKCLDALKTYRDAKTRHVPGAALIGLRDTLHHAVFSAFQKTSQKT